MTNGKRAFLSLASIVFALIFIFEGGMLCADGFNSVASAEMEAAASVPDYVEINTVRVPLISEDSFVVSTDALPDFLKPASEEGHIIRRVGLNMYYDETAKLLYGGNGHGLAYIGFDFDDEQDIFISANDPWQRRFGYCDIYDKTAFIIALYFNTRKFEFEYGDYVWRIQFWKGQYGITSGAEIGIYKKPTTRRIGFFDCVDPEDEMAMSFDLYKNQKYYFSRAEDKHWWLTGFNLVDATIPQSFTMDGHITFNSTGMRDAFIECMKSEGFAESQAPYDDFVGNYFESLGVFFVNENTVRFIW